MSLLDPLSKEKPPLPLPEVFERVTTGMAEVACLFGALPGFVPQAAISGQARPASFTAGLAALTRSGP